MAWGVGLRGRACRVRVCVCVERHMGGWRGRAACARPPRQSRSCQRHRAIGHNGHVRKALGLSRGCAKGTTSLRPLAFVPVAGPAAVFSFGPSRPGAGRSRTPGGWGLYLPLWRRDKHAEEMYIASVKSIASVCRVCPRDRAGVRSWPVSLPRALCRRMLCSRMFAGTWNGVRIQARSEADNLAFQSLCVRMSRRKSAQQADKYAMRLASVYLRIVPRCICSAFFYHVFAHGHHGRSVAAALLHCYRFIDVAWLSLLHSQSCIVVAPLSSLQSRSFILKTLLAQLVCRTFIVMRALRERVRKRPGTHAQSEQAPCVGHVSACITGARARAHGRTALPRGGMCNNVRAGCLCLEWHVSCRVWVTQGLRPGR